MRRKKRNNGIICAAISLAAVILIGGIIAVKAGGSFSWERVEQYTGLAIADKVDSPLIEEEPSLGAIPGNEIYEQIRFYEGLRTAYDIEIDLNLTATSSTDTDPIMGEFCNMGSDPLLIANWGIHILDPNENFGFSMNVGTTTCEAYSNRRCIEYASEGGSTGTTTPTMLATSGTDSKTYIATSTAGSFWRDDIMNYLWHSPTGLDATNASFATMTPGSFYENDGAFGADMGSTSTPFVLDTNECIVINDTAIGGATSSHSYTTGQGDFDARFYADTKIE